ncbi:MAG: hypothetical protein GXP62_04175 [Oligoflexia bacterium]|nr:hypothetical protein [Oligoflexia bacterium]
MLHITLFTLGFLSVASCGPNNPKYSEEIIGREEYKAPAPGATQGGKIGGGSGGGSASAGGATARDAVACDATFAAPKKGDVTSTIKCGGSVTASTEGGSSSFGDDFYQRAFCTPARKHYDDAPEAIYLLEVPADIQATVSLSSPCADLDIAAISWALGGLPTLAQVGRVRECEMDTKEGDGKLKLTSVNKSQVYLITVDGKQGAAAPFRIDVACGTYR